MSAIVKNYQFTIDQYHKMGEANILHEDSRVELIEGEIITMTPIGRMHAGIVDYLVRTFTEQLQKNVIVHVQNPIVLNEYTEPQPDLTLLKPRDDFYRSKDVRPDDVYLIVEVADSSVRYDRLTKVPLYAKHNIPEVWIVDIETHTIDVYSQPSQNEYSQTQRFDNEEILKLQTFPNFQTTPKAVFGE